MIKLNSRKALYLWGVLSWAHVAFYSIVWMILLFYDVEIINEFITYLIGALVITPGIIMAIICSIRLGSNPED